jgi:hypothetical protein
MYKLSEKQEKAMDKAITAAADKYAAQLMNEIKVAVAFKDQNRLVTEPNEDGIPTTTFFSDKTSYIRAGIMEMAQSITGKPLLPTYETYSEHLIIFEQFVNDKMKDGWVFSYGENDDNIATKLEEVAV